MFHLRFKSDFGPWVIPAIYAAIAFAAALTVPHIEGRIAPWFVSPVSVSSAQAIYSSIASGMMALTGIVFSLMFVMIQFSAVAYSPRLVLLIIRDPVTSHALGIFTATFVYAIAALTGVDRNGFGSVPYFSILLVFALVLGSVGMFIALINRTGVLQINRMLSFTGDQGRKVITAMYPALSSAAAPPAVDTVRSLPRKQTLVHHGLPRSIQAIDVGTLVHLAKMSGGIIEMLAAVGDTVVELTPLLYVAGAREPIAEAKLMKAIRLGRERTFAQDPKYALRLLVDIAIRALSPAINDPTTAVQALDQIEDLLLRLGQRNLDIGAHRDGDGQLRLVVVCPTWDDLLRLSFDEICFCGATSIQVMRRMNALVADLTRAVPEEHRPALRFWNARLKASIARSFADGEERIEASKEDRQGLGVPREHPEASTQASR